jgi:hypothetical protein
MAVLVIGKQMGPGAFQSPGRSASTQLGDDRILGVRISESFKQICAVPNAHGIRRHRVLRFVRWQTDRPELED